MGWHKNASDGSALLATLHGHFFAHLFDEEVKFRCAWNGIGAKNGGIQRVGLHIEWHRVFCHSGIGLQLFACGRGPREGDHVPFIHEIQDVSGRPADKLKRSRRKDATVVNGGHHGLREKGGDSGRFDNGGHPSKPVDRHFFQHAPHREVEGVDVNGDALLGHQQVMSSKRSFPPQRHKISIGGKRRVWKLSSK